MDPGFGWFEDKGVDDCKSASPSISLFPSDSNVKSWGLYKMYYNYINLKS